MNRKIVLSIAVVFAALYCIHSVSAKSMYLIANHHKATFDAWDIAHSGVATYQATYICISSDPAGIAHHLQSNTLFLTSEFSSGVEMVNGTTMQSIGVAPGPSDLAGVDIDDDTNILYTIVRMTNILYAYDFNPAASPPTLTLKSGFPINLPGCSQGLGISLDTTTDTLWVADAGAGVARAYDINTWTEIISKSFTPSHKPVDIEVDRVRQVVYTTSMYGYDAWLPLGTGSNLLSKFDLTSRVETTIDMGHDGVGIAVDEETGYVYVTGGRTYDGSEVDNLEVWDTSTSPWTLIQKTGDIGDPAGICIPRLGGGGYNKLNIKKSAPVEYVKPGDTITFTISFDNAQNNQPVTNVVLVDELPPDAAFVSASDGGTYDAGTHKVTWNIGTLPAYAPTQYRYLTVTINPNVNPGDKITNYATINGAEPGTGPTTVRVTVIVAPPIIESCDEFGVKKDVFNPSENVSAYGSGYQPQATYTLYIEPDKVWVDGTPLTGTPVTIKTSITGTIPPTVIWNAPLTPGKFDIVVDVNGNGVYDAGIDALDDNDVVRTAGFLAIPEYWLGTILSIAGCFAALATFRATKRKHN